LGDILPGIVKSQHFTAQIVPDGIPSRVTDVIVKAILHRLIRRPVRRAMIPAKPSIDQVTASPMNFYQISATFALWLLKLGPDEVQGGVNVEELGVAPLVASGHAQSENGARTALIHGGPSPVTGFQDHVFLKIGKELPREPFDQVCEALGFDFLGIQLGVGEPVRLILSAADDLVPSDGRVAESEVPASDEGDSRVRISKANMMLRLKLRHNRRPIRNEAIITIHDTFGLRFRVGGDQIVQVARGKVRILLGGRLDEVIGRLTKGLEALFQAKEPRNPVAVGRGVGGQDSFEVSARVGQPQAADEAFEGLLRLLLSLIHVEPAKVLPQPAAQVLRLSRHNFRAIREDKFMRKTVTVFQARVLDLCPMQHLQPFIQCGVMQLRVRAANDNPPVVRDRQSEGQSQCTCRYRLP
jgi:hypothetical protein